MPNGPLRTYTIEVPAPAGYNAISLYSFSASATPNINCHIDLYNESDVLLNSVSCGGGQANHQHEFPEAIYPIGRVKLQLNLQYINNNVSAPTEANFIINSRFRFINIEEPSEPELTPAIKKSTLFDSFQLGSFGSIQVSPVTKSYRFSKPEGFSGFIGMNQIVEGKASFGGVSGTYLCTMKYTGRIKVGNSYTSVFTRSLSARNCSNLKPFYMKTPLVSDVYDDVLLTIEVSRQFGPAVSTINVAFEALWGDEADRDGDGLPAWYEEFYGFSDNDASDAFLDSDNDGYTNLEEYLAGTNPKDPNSKPN